MRLCLAFVAQPFPVRSASALRSQACGTGGAVSGPVLDLDASNGASYWPGAPTAWNDLSTAANVAALHDAPLARRARARANGRAHARSASRLLSVSVCVLSLYLCVCV